MRGGREEGRKGGREEGRKGSEGTEEGRKRSSIDSLQIVSFALITLLLKSHI